MVGSEVFLMKPNHQFFYPNEENEFMVPIRKRKVIIMSIVFIPIDRLMILKNGRKRSFSYETKKSMSFIPIRQMSLWFFIMKRKKIML